MNKKINESINFLLSEYKRLISKKNKKNISKEEYETLIKLKLFLKKDRD